jgi:hypothetical protein
MPTVRFSMEEKDGFEAQTDRMTTVDALAELLMRVNVAHQGTGVSQELLVNYETTKDGYRYILDATPVDKPAMTSEDRTAGLFVAGRVLMEIEEMLDPKGRSFWKLELKQRRPGKRTVPLAIATDIYQEYGDARCFERETPAKVVIGRLAKRHGLPDTTIRQIIRRERVKEPKK